MIWKRSGRSSRKPRVENCAGQVLYRMDDPAEYLFVFVNGRVQMSRPTTSGREVLVSVLGANGPCESSIRTASCAAENAGK